MGLLLIGFNLHFGNIEVMIEMFVEKRLKDNSSHSHLKEKRRNVL
jgi:hypothetical protein